MREPRPTSVRLGSLPVIGSPPGTPSTLPQLRPVRAAGTTRVSDGAPPDMLERVARGRLSSPLPYGVLSDYDRGDHELELPMVELDNGHVRVQVLPSLGGRVWSMVDLATGRELLHRNPRLRWANFGLTDAWFAGGIEWNLGSTGHATTSNLPMHAAVLDTELGPVVRLWEWERTRDLVLQVDLWLSGPRLLASTRVINPDPEPKPLYYWTNIAVPETAGSRVLVPADTAWRTDYKGVLERVAIPFPDGDVDVSIPRASRYAADYFFEVGGQRGRVVTAVEPDGHGFAQTSTDALRGRKLFLWGHGPGGQRWQDWLGVPGTRYLEIQAGVCTTQLEHDVIKGHETRSWTEAFAALDLDPAVVTDEYAAASAAARDAVHATTPPDWLEEQHARWLASVAHTDPGTPTHTGSGWGRVELALRGIDAPHGLVFPEVDDDSRLLAPLAETTDPTGLQAISPERPVLPVVSDRWFARLADTTTNGDGAWWVEYALATNHHLRDDRPAAHAAYTRSVDLQPSAVALRGLAVLTDDAAQRADLYARARELAPDDRRLAVEALADLQAAGRHEDVVHLVAELPRAIREHGRTRMMLAESLAALGRADEALVILADLEVPDLAEGDRALAEVWERLRPDEPVPNRLDFRMSGDAGDGT
ncbi:DUF5107 domain-containing protein [Knoellia koreensis]|uniref:DUF5107 domain-containing protein n=1 Tax=Knoellia koreensis TaxID=2730921 RepID=A0A849HGF4_9MICO|nr:DUF5107 domain-containing protein [Knoellia sp. DB2414S]